MRPSIQNQKLYTFLLPLSIAKQRNSKTLFILLQISNQTYMAPSARELSPPPPKKEKYIFIMVGISNAFFRPIKKYVIFPIKQLRAVFDCGTP